MYYCCRGCGNCIEKTCDGICSCIQQFCECISEIFKEPFSFVTFLALLFCGGPFTLGIIVFIQSQDVQCDNWIKDHLIIMAVCNLSNFLFCLYIYCNYGRNPEKLNDERLKDKNAMELTGYLILYDFAVCFYFIIYLFEIVWMIIGHSLYRDTPDDSQCFQANSGLLRTGFLINIIFMDLYLLISFTIFVVSLIYYACKDGSCECGEFCHCWCLLLTCGYCCGICAPIKRERQDRRRDQRQLKENERKERQRQQEIQEQQRKNQNNINPGQKQQQQQQPMEVGKWLDKQANQFFSKIGWKQNQVNNQQKYQPQDNRQNVPYQNPQNLQYNPNSNNNPQNLQYNPQNEINPYYAGQQNMNQQMYDEQQRKMYGEQGIYIPPDDIQVQKNNDQIVNQQFGNQQYQGYQNQYQNDAIKQQQIDIQPQQLNQPVQQQQKPYNPYEFPQMSNEQNKPLKDEKKKESQKKPFYQFWG